MFHYLCLVTKDTCSIAWDRTKNELSYLDVYHFSAGSDHLSVRQQSRFVSPLSLHFDLSVC